MFWNLTSQIEKNFKKNFIINNKELVVNAIISIKEYKFEKRFIKLDNIRNLILETEIEMKKNIM